MQAYHSVHASEHESYHYCSFLLFLLNDYLFCIMHVSVSVCRSHHATFFAVVSILVVIQEVL